MLKYEIFKNISEKITLHPTPISKFMLGVYNFPFASIIALVLCVRDSISTDEEDIFISLIIVLLLKLDNPKYITFTASGEKINNNIENTPPKIMVYR